MAFIVDNDNNLNNTTTYIPSCGFYHPLTLISAVKPRKKRTPKLLKITTGISKPKPTRKPDPSAPKITRPCTECGKKFWSWKALFGHMRCHPERTWRGINPPPKFRRSDEYSDEDDGDYSSAVTDEDHEVATCLLLLSNGPTRVTNQSPSLTTVNQVPEYSSDPTTTQFECSSCKKVFGSHQALGGHRASHKNVKGCYAINRNYEDEEGNKEEGDDQFGHNCSTCRRVFSSGQALGGHVRCHWEPSTSASSPIRVTNYGSNLNFPFHQNEHHDASSGYNFSAAGVALDLRLGL